MGVFSWCTSDTKKSIPCCRPFGDLPGTVYLLNPFGEPYKETDYEGYGVFGEKDIYDLVVEWNREYLSADNIRKPSRSNYEAGEQGDIYYEKAMSKYQATCDAIIAYKNGASDDFMKEHFGMQIAPWGDGSDWKRVLGISLACYDEDHVKLKYPIKIVEHPMPYDEAGISPSCPFQGYFYPDYPNCMQDIRYEVDKAFAHLAMEEEKWRTASSLDNKIKTADKNSENSHSIAKQTVHHKDAPDRE